MQSALITGLASTELSDDERAFLRDVRPAGIILFTRNARDHGQIRALVADARAAAACDDFLVLIDQEGGRVQRLRGALGRELPPARRYGELYARDAEAAREAAFSIARLIADDLKDLGINTNCAPVLDLPVPGAHDIVGDRAYATNASDVIALGAEVIDGYKTGGVVPVIKHVPGHGRATADSHLALPVVEEPRETLSRTDFVPFRALSGAPAAMTAHVVYADIDANEPASTSNRVLGEIVRGEMSFDGLLMSDDLSMQALKGPMRTRAERVIAAGCDLALHCNGQMEEMLATAEGVPQLSGRAAKRFSDACRITRKSKPYDREQALWLLAGMLKPHSPEAESV